jgi:hypothetical protein
MMRIVYDIDGTIDLELWSAWSHRPDGRFFVNPSVNPSKVKYIVTGRPEHHREYTLRILKQMGITPKVLFMNALGILDQEYVMKMKAAYLNILLADVYVDDDIIWKFKFHKYWDGIIIDSTELGRYV